MASQKNNFLKSYPGIDEPKIMKVLENLPEELKSESQPFGEILKNADQIDFNVKTSHRLDTQWYHNIGLYSLGGSSWMMFGLAILVIYCVNRSYRNQQIIARNWKNIIQFKLNILMNIQIRFSKNKVIILLNNKLEFFYSHFFTKCTLNFHLAFMVENCIHSWIVLFGE